MSQLSMAAQVRPAKQAGMASVVFAGSVGTIVEWYDFLIYGVASALFFNTMFFPTFDPLTGRLAALGTYAAGFVARPLGGAIFGHFGDRVGRKTMLMLTMAIMALGTFAVGLMPTYDQIGIWAPILLVSLRIIQGVALGGEWGGASLMVLEHSPGHRRGFYGALVQVGFPIGLIASTGVFAFISAIISDEQFRAWGWRIPFLLSILLLLVGWYVRARVPETPVFEELKRKGHLAKNPFFEALLKNPKSFLVAVGLKISEVCWVYILTIFLVIYATSNLNIPKQTYLNAITLAAVGEIFSIPFFGWLSDVFGRRTLYFFGTIFTVCFAFPLFWLLDTREPTMIYLAVAVALSFGHGTMFGLQSAYFPELFGARVRYSGASVGFQTAAAVGGGFAPIVATALVGYTGGTAGVSVMLGGLAVITFIATLLARETKNESLFN